MLMIYEGDEQSIRRIAELAADVGLHECTDVVHAKCKEIVQRASSVLDNVEKLKRGGIECITDRSSTKGSPSNPTAKQSHT